VATLVVTDDQGLVSSAATRSVTITAPPVVTPPVVTPPVTPPANVAPVAAISEVAGNVVGAAITFVGNGSSDSDGTVSSYAWSFGDGANGTGVSPTHAYGAAGTYVVSLVVTDDKGLASPAVTRSVTITAPPVVTPPTNVAPTAAIAAL